MLILVSRRPFRLAGLGDRRPRVIIGGTATLTGTTGTFGIPAVLADIVTRHNNFVFPRVLSIFPNRRIVSQALVGA